MKSAAKKISVILFNACLLLLALIIPSMIFATSENFYRETLRSCDLYSEVTDDGAERRRIIYYVGGDADCAVTLSDEQLDLVVSHITAFLTGKKESFELTLDRVDVIGVGVSDGVSLFGEAAVSHMNDVKQIMTVADFAAAVCAAMLLGLICFFIIKRREMSRLIFKYSLLFYGVLIGAALIFVLVSLASATKEIPFFLRLWKNLHYIIFPFQPKKVADSVLSDALTCILTTDFFMIAVARVLATVSLTVAFWLSSAAIAARLSFWKKSQKT